jgi:Fic family protein
VKTLCAITLEILGLCADLERLIGRSEGLGGAAPPAPQLRRKNRIRTVQATTAIEGNTLPLEQVTALLDGKRVRGPAREVAEVENAIAAYALVPTLDPLVERDLLRAHATLLKGLADDAGRYRRGNVGIVTGSRVTHMAPPAKRAPTLMRELFQFARRDRTTPALVKACVLHYELECIHPFSDGNGRLGRLWQHALLCQHAPVFAHVPVESVIKQRQVEYYAALAASDRAGDATAFVAFMLQVLLTALEEFLREYRPTRLDAAARLELAARHFGTRSFSRKDYLELHPTLSAPTASRDLREGVGRARLHVEGDKRTARYAFGPVRGKRA